MIFGKISIPVENIKNLFNVQTLNQSDNQHAECMGTPCVSPECLVRS